MTPAISLQKTIYISTLTTKQKCYVWLYKVCTLFPAKGHLAEEAEEPGIEPTSLVMPCCCRVTHRKRKVTYCRKGFKSITLVIIKVSQCNLIGGKSQIEL